MTKPDNGAAFGLERLLRQAHHEGVARDAEDEYGFLTWLDEEGAVDTLTAARTARIESDPVERAQELAFQAYEAESADDAERLAEAALAVDPACVDALTVRAFIVSENAGDLLAALEHAVTVAEETLGDAFFEEYAGDFQALIPARPYVRALRQYAEVCWEVGRRFDAIDLYESILDLDPQHHLGNGTLLLGNYLAMGEVQRAWDLLEEMADDDGVVQAWAWVLVFLLGGDDEAALDALNHALDLNPYVAPRILGLGGDERELGLTVEPGGEDEAQFCEQVLGEAWDRAPEALDWLSGVLTDLGLVDGDEEPPRSLN